MCYVTLTTFPALQVSKSVPVRCVLCACLLVMENLLSLPTYNTHIVLCLFAEVYGVHLCRVHSPCL